jgi:hypothetical protein
VLELVAAFAKAAGKEVSFNFMSSYCT